MLSEREREIIRNFFKTNCEIVAVYVFGSTARGRIQKDSDIDIAIMVHRSMAGFSRIKMETEISNLLEKNVEIVICTDASPLLQHQVLKYGFLIYDGSLPLDGGGTGWV